MKDGPTGSRPDSRVGLLGVVSCRLQFSMTAAAVAVCLLVVSCSLFRGKKDYPNRLVATIEFAEPPVGIVALPNGKFIYAATGHSISVIDAAANTVCDSVQAGSYLFNLAVTADGQRVLATDEDANQVVILRTSDNTVEARIDVGERPWGVAVTADGRRAFVTNRTDGTVSVIDLESCEVLDSLVVGNNPLGIVLDATEQKFFVANGDDDAVVVYGVAGLDSIASQHCDFFPGHLALHPSGQSVYVSTNYGVKYINTDDYTLHYGPAVGEYPRGMTFSPDGKYLYVANHTSNDVSVCRLPDGKLVASLSAGSYPFGVAVHPDGDRLYVTNNTSVLVFERDN